MPNQVLTVISLFALRLGVPLLVTFVRGMLLSRREGKPPPFSLAQTVTYWQPFMGHVPTRLDRVHVVS